MDRRKRRRFRLIPIVGYTIFALGVAYFFTQRASTTVIFVRHADTDESMPSDDPPLNARGRARAELLADFLEKFDVTSGVNAIYASDKRRTQETAAPLAARLHIPVEIEDHFDTGGFMRRVWREHQGQIILVVSHSNTIAPLIDEIHGKKGLAPIEHDDYNNVYIVSSPWYGKVKTYFLEYPDPSSTIATSGAAPAASLTAEPASADGGK